MSETPRTWTLVAAPNEHGEPGSLFWGVNGPPPARDRERRKVYEAGPVDTEQERILDLLEDAREVLQEGYKNAPALESDIDALLREHGRLPKEASDEH